MRESHARVTTPAGVQGDASVGHFDQLQFPSLVLQENHHDIQPGAFGIPLQIFACWNLPVAHVTCSDEIFDHGELDAPILENGSQLLVTTLALGASPLPGTYRLSGTPRRLFPSNHVKSHAP